jgi:hypothetical protein
MNIIELIMAIFIVTSSYLISRVLAATFGVTGWIVGCFLGIGAFIVLQIISSRRTHQNTPKQSQRRFIGTTAFLTIAAFFCAGYVGGSLMSAHYGVVGAALGVTLGISAFIFICSVLNGFMQKIRSSRDHGRHH